MRAPSIIAGLLIALAATTACRSDERQTELPASRQIERLQAPGRFATSPARHKDNGSSCDMPLRPYTSPMDFPSKYEGSGKSRDTLNDDADRRYKAAIADISALETTYAKVVARYLQNGAVDDLACATRVLDSWAMAGALLGNAPSYNGKAVRKWALASISSAYLRFKLSPEVPLAAFRDQERHIDAWLKKLGDRVASEWPTDDPLNKINNHYYWSAWALVATGTAINDRSLFEQGLRLYRVFETQVTSDGVLPNELARKSRALEYHVFALGPLAMVASFANVNGYRVDVSENSPLARLATLAFTGLRDPETIAKRAGVRQETFDSDATNYAWMEPYCYVAACPDSLQRQLANVRPLSSTRLGGNLSQIFEGQSTP